jgi:hypothetical protein
MNHPLMASIAEIDFLQERIREKNARVEQLETALRWIARQHLYEEMEEGWRDSADWEAGYEAIIGIARAVLEQDK